MQTPCGHRAAILVYGPNGRCQCCGTFGRPRQSGAGGGGASGVGAQSMVEKSGMPEVCPTLKILTSTTQCQNARPHLNPKPEPRNRFPEFLRSSVGSCQHFSDRSYGSFPEGSQKLPEASQKLTEGSKSCRKLPRACGLS